MNIYTNIREQLNAVLADLGAEGALPADLDTKNVAIEPPRDSSHGDIALNAALVLSKQARMKPRDIAGLLAEKLEALAFVSAVDVAGPGFINMTLSPSYWQAIVRHVIADGTSFGDSETGAGEKVNVEYVSANPTGPMHVGHVRGAVFGDALANLLTKAGFDVSKEYYINDAGNQIDILAESVYLRYREAHGEVIEIPEGLYPGAYLKEAAQTLMERHGDRFMKASKEEWLPVMRLEGTELMMDLIRSDLAALGVEHDVFFSEKTLHSSGRIADAIAVLRERGYIYEGVLEPPKGKKPEDWEAREQTLFKAEQFGDDVDRPIQKSNGDYTYFAADIAYHYDKYIRGFKKMINVWGADHGGYIKRMEAAINAMADDGSLDVRLCQLVKLFRDGEPVKMSKRAGTFITLREVVDEVGKDVTRFIMLTRKNDAPLDFDYAKVLEQSKDNPVFYVQYAHARVNSLQKKAVASHGDLDLAGADVGSLTHEAEIGLMKQMAAWPRMVESAATAHEPHRIAFYLYDLASSFHSYYNLGNSNPELRLVLEADKEKTLSRMALARSVATVIASGLYVLGVTPVEEM
ncbi:arginine--tRNA ligase [Temperatibacter marinus]|uniref:Arginine--tRNA ligase n=1 Tax=Temperatibacter marinus TaxID=1456591 RepID=A0AA52H8Z3_9PROT|nr:arginine--tRNA ligase [Temperatibacter marinus]WND02631.1 arginine--tRNA ligase [Temperatibacter marinus]